MPMTSPVLSLCVLVVCALVWNSCGAQESDIVLKANPQAVTDGLTDELTFDCRPSPSIADNVKAGVVLRFFKNNGSDVIPVATATQMGKIIVDDASASAKGHLRQMGDEQSSFLTVSYQDPSFTEEGVFTCQFHYMDSKYAVHLASASVNVTVDEAIPPTTPEMPMAIEPEVIPDVEIVNVTQCTCDDVWAEINALKETLVMENKLLKKEVQKYDESCRVSFSARMADDAPIMQDAEVTFDDVISNKGGAFQKTSFVAPCTGQYFFSLTLRSNQMMDGGYVDGVIAADDVEVARTSVFSDFSAMNYQSATNGAVVTLTQGQEVNVKIKTTSRGKLIGSTHTVFSGFYLYP